MDGGGEGGVSKTLPISVSNPSFAIDRLGHDCLPGQYLRELTHNSIQAIQKTRGKSGQILWTHDQEVLSQTGIRKLCLVDNGIGMSPDEMVLYINHLFSSSNTMSGKHNYGVGAKIAAGIENPQGLVYTSWKNGAGYRIHFWKDSEQGYGLKQFPDEEGNMQPFIRVSNEYKPSIIKRHGTVVTLLGQSEEHDTTVTPSDLPGKHDWIRRNLNSRYSSIPEGISIDVEVDGNTSPVAGESMYLEECCLSSGTLLLADARVHWWLLDENTEADHVEYNGHTAALYNGELYEIKNGRAGRSILENFGILQGAERVVLYVDPNPYQNQDLEANTARSALTLNRSALPWTEWQEQFRKNMPGELRDYVGSLLSQTSTPDHTQKLADRFGRHSQMFDMGRFRPSQRKPPSTKTGGRKTRQGKSTHHGSSSRGERKTPDVGNVFSETAVQQSIPEIAWVRKDTDIDDRAAKYNAATHTLIINEDFRGYKTVLSKYLEQYAHVQGASEPVENEVRLMFEQTLCEAIISIHALKNSAAKRLGDGYDEMLEPAGLTAAVMAARTQIDETLAAVLKKKLGRPDGVVLQTQGPVEEKS